jgi:hypothetical protein
MELEIIIKRLEFAWESETKELYRDLLKLKTAMSDEIKEILKQWYSLSVLLNSYKEDRDKINFILKNK